MRSQSWCQKLQRVLSNLRAHEIWKRKIVTSKTRREIETTKKPGTITDQTKQWSTRKRTADIDWNLYAKQKNINYLIPLILLGIHRIFYRCCSCVYSSGGWIMSEGSVFCQSLPTLLSFMFLAAVLVFLNICSSSKTAVLWQYFPLLFLFALYFCPQAIFKARFASTFHTVLVIFSTFLFHYNAWKRYANFAEYIPLNLFFLFYFLG